MPSSSISAHIARCVNAWIALRLESVCRCHRHWVRWHVASQRVYSTDSARCGLAGGCLAEGRGDVYPHMQPPKLLDLRAHRQHAKTDDASIIRLVRCLFGALPLHAKLFGARMAVFRRKWNYLMGLMQIPRRQVARGATPGVLRGPRKDLGILCARGGSPTFSSSTVTSCSRACFFLGTARPH